MTAIPRGAGAGLSARWSRLVALGRGCLSFAFGAFVFCYGAVHLLLLGWGSCGERLEGEAAVEEAPEDEVLPVGEDMKAQAYPQHPQPPRPAETLVGQHTE